MLLEKGVRLIELCEGRRLEILELDMLVFDFSQYLLHIWAVLVFIETNDAVDPLTDEEVDGWLCKILRAISIIRIFILVVVGSGSTVEFVSTGYRVGYLVESVPSGFVGHVTRNQCKKLMWGCGGRILQKKGAIYPFSGRPRIQNVP